MYWYTTILIISIGLLIEEQICQNITSSNVTIVANCKELFSTTLEIECFNDTKLISCDEPMANGTIAKLKCKDSYHLEIMPFDNIFCEGGQWNRPLFNCEPVCGQLTPIGTKLIIKGEQAERGRFPWHIALYKKKKKAHTYICGGSIISPKLVITAAHCFFSNEPKMYAVAAGKIERKWNSELNEHIQRRDVIEIIISKGYKGELNAYASDIAILALSEAFVLSNLILPVCWGSNIISFTNIQSTVAEVPGWGLTAEQGKLSNYLQYARLPLIRNEDCFANVPVDFSPYVTLDKFCAGYNNDSGINVCQGDSGGGLVISKTSDNNTEQYYLIGLVSTSPFKEDSCDSYSYTTFTNIMMYVDWINSTKFQYETWSPYDYGCFLPEPPSFGNYTINSVIASVREPFVGDLVPQYTKLKYSCDPGYMIKGEEIVTCRKKFWFVNNYLPSCFRTCPKLISRELSIKYVGTREMVTNDVYSHETHAFFSCLDINYELEDPKYKQTTCRDGQWTKTVPNCIPICGVGSELPLSNTLRKINVIYPGQYPWIVRICMHLNNSKISATNCSGIIISPWIVITEMDCISSQLQKHVVVANNELDLMFESGFQIIPLHRKISHYNFDIIILKTRLSITPFVKPVCLNPNIIQSTINISKVDLPFWTVENDMLRTIKMISNGRGLFRIRDDIIRGKSHCGYFRPGGITVPLESYFQTRNYLIGFGKRCIKKKKFQLYFFTRDDIEFIQNTVKQFESKSLEISECQVPDSPIRGKIVGDFYDPGEIVLEGTKINYICESYYSLHGSNEIVCINNSWIYPSGIPTCKSCGISNIKNVNKSEDIELVDLPTPELAAFPWHVGIYVVLKTPKLICSGTILSPKIVLSLGSSLYQYKNPEYHNISVLTNLDYFQRNSTPSLQDINYNVEELIFQNKDKELVLIVLKNNLEITKYVAPICLSVLRNILLRDETIMPTWWNKTNDSIELKYMRLSENLLIQRNLIYTIKYRYKNVSFNNIPKSTKGSAAVFRIEIHSGSHYFIFGVLSDIHTYGLDFINLYPIMNWIRNNMNEIN